MPKLLELVDKEGEARVHQGWMIFCPACKTGHLFDQRWTFNGNQERPTFRASMLSCSRWPGGESRCHSYVTDGRIEFLADSTHALAGTTVDLPDWD